MHRPLRGYTCTYLGTCASVRYPRTAQCLPTLPRSPEARFMIPRIHEMPLNPSLSSRDAFVGLSKKSLTIRPTAPFPAKISQKTRSQQHEATSSPFPPLPKPPHVPQPAHPFFPVTIRPGPTRFRANDAGTGIAVSPTRLARCSRPLQDA